jgi:hypothetical protein
MPVILGDTSITSSNGELSTPSAFVLSSANTPLSINSSWRRLARTVPYNIAGTPSQWTRLGRITGAAGQGGGMRITFNGTFGFNAGINQLGRSCIEMYGSNNNSGNFNINGRFWHEGDFANRFVRNVKIVSVNGVVRDNVYDIYIESIWYSPNTSMDIEVAPGWNFEYANEFGTFVSSPGAASTTIRDFHYGRGMGMVAAINFNAKTSAITYNHGFSSVSNFSANNYELTFSYTHPDADYYVAFMCAFDTGSTGDTTVSFYGDGVPPNTTSFRIRTNQGRPDFIQLAVFRPS